MRRLLRGTKPACLLNYKHGRDNWGDVKGIDKAQIWVSLDSMQGDFCAYCEARLGSGKHIEHFKQKGRFPKLTFDWDNLFGSCGSAESCGKSKDSFGPYDEKLLIKPDVEDPDAHFLFLKDGAIQLRAKDIRRGAKTLEVFGLDSPGGKLRQQRRSAIKGHMLVIEQFREMIESDPANKDYWVEALRGELAHANDEPFATAVRHVYESFL